MPQSAVHFFERSFREFPIKNLNLRLNPGVVNEREIVAHLAFTDSVNISYDPVAIVYTVNFAVLKLSE